MVEGSPRDAENLEVLTGLRQDYPHLKILVSVGGWTWSKGFSDAALTARSRRLFAASAVDFVKRHDLDGLDVDWEYPGLQGDANPHRPEDKENFTALMTDLRAALDREGGARRGKHLLLTFAAGAFPDFVAHTEMAKVQAAVDYVNLMTYDFRVASPGEPAGHHANLTPEPGRPAAAVGRRCGRPVPRGRRPRREARPRCAVLRARLGRRRVAGRPLPAGPAARGAYRLIARRSRGARRQGRLGPRVGRCGAGAVPVERAEADIRDVRGRGVAAAEEPLRAGARARRRDVLGVPLRPLRSAPRHARRGAARRRRPSALGRVALRARPQGRGPLLVMGRPRPRRPDPPPRRPAGAGQGRGRERRHALDRPDRRPHLLHVATLCALPPAREREGAVLAAAGQGLRRAGVVPARRGRARGLGGPAPRASPRAAALADARVGGRPARRLERQPLDPARVRPRHGARTRASPAHDPRRQPARGRRGHRTRTASPTTRRATGTASLAGSSCARRAPSTSRTCRRSRAWRPRPGSACAAGSATRRASRVAEPCSWR